MAFLMKIAAVYTGQGLCDPLVALFKEVIPECSLVNIIDDSIIRDVKAAGGMTKAVALRLLDYFRKGEELGADYILNTCSSVGEVVAPARAFISAPIIRIDDPMAEEAVRTASRIGVIATLPTTLAPTMRLIGEKAAEAGKTVEVADGLAKGAYEALVAGDTAGHDNLILSTAKQLAGKVDCIVLAQGSMMRMRERLARETGIPVLASPICCAQYIKTLMHTKPQ
jgi:Hydantoin racemase